MAVALIYCGHVISSSRWPLTGQPSVIYFSVVTQHARWQTSPDGTGTHGQRQPHLLQLCGANQGETGQFKFVIAIAVCCRSKSIYTGMCVTNSQLSFSNGCN